MEFALKLRKAAAENDMSTIKKMMSSPEYNVQQGKEAIGIAFTRKNNGIAYQLLSFPGALDEFFNHPFKVDNGLKEDVMNYINNNNIN